MDRREGCCLFTAHGLPEPQIGIDYSSSRFFINFGWGEEQVINIDGMNVLVILFVVTKVVMVSGIVVAVFFSGKLLRDALRLRLVKRHVKKSKECAALLLSKNLYVVYVNNYNKTFFPFLREEIIGSSLWDKLVPDYAVHLNKGYQDSLMQKHPVTIGYSINGIDKVHHFKLVFVPTFQSYVVCYICFIPHKQTIGAN